LGWGLLLVSFASSLGATVSVPGGALCVARTWCRRALAHRLADINQGVARDGALYLFSLRLIPVVPFFVINLAMGLTSHAHPDLLLGESARHAGRHGGVRERRHTAGRAAVAQGHCQPRSCWARLCCSVCFLSLQRRL